MYSIQWINYIYSIVSCSLFYFYDILYNMIDYPHISTVNRRMLDIHCIINDWINKINIYSQLSTEWIIIHSPSSLRFWPSTCIFVKYLQWGKTTLLLSLEQTSRILTTLKISRFHHRDHLSGIHDRFHCHIFHRRVCMKVYRSIPASPFQPWLDKIKYQRKLFPQM